MARDGVSKKKTIPKQFLGAFKAGHRPSAREFIDEELAFEMLDRWYASNGQDKQATETLEYLTKFNNEFHKNVVSKTDPLHTDEPSSEPKTDLYGNVKKDSNGKIVYKTQKQTLYDRENARNRDIMSVRKYNIVSLEQKAQSNNEED